MASDADSVVEFPSPQVMTTPEQALRKATARGLDAVLILGETPEGTLYVRSSGNINRKDALWLIEQARLNALGFDE